jgi:hypothetical protein
MTSTTTDRRFGVNGGIAIKAPVRAATTANITLSGLQTIDGVVLVADDRVLVKNQTTASQNGIYLASTGAWSRSIDANGNRDLVKGTVVLVTDGTAQAGQWWEITTSGTITVDTTSITWALSLTASISTLSFLQSGTGATTRTGLSKLRDIVSVYDFGAVGDGVTDDAAAFQAAFTAARAVDARGGSFKISSTVTIPAGRFLDRRGSDIIANTGVTPLFKFDSAHEGLYILAGGGSVSGTASAYLQCVGTTDTPTLASHYARQIRIEGEHVTSTTITNFLVFQDAVRQVFLDKCYAFTIKGIVSDTKGVEIFASNLVLYSSTGAAGTYGVKMSSVGGTTYYNEGWHFTNCLIDNFEIGVDVYDSFVLTMVGSYVSSIAGGYAFQFSAPTTNLNECTTIGTGCVFGNRIRFAASGAGRAYNTKIHGAIFNGVPGTAIALENNAANVTVSDCKFKAGSGTAVGIAGTNNNANIIVSDLEFDTTYTNGVVLNGAAGAGCSVGPLNGATSGDIIGAGRSNITYRNIPVISSTVAAFRQTYNSTDLAGAYAVGATIATLTLSFAKGERGYVDVSLACSSMATTSQRLDIRLRWPSPRP